MRDASLEDLSNDLSEINKIGGQLSKEVKKVESDFSSWTTPPELKGNLLDELKPDASSPAPSDATIVPVSKDDKA